MQPFTVGGPEVVEGSRVSDVLDVVQRGLTVPEETDDLEVRVEGSLRVGP